MAPISDAGGLARMADAGNTWVRRSGVYWPDVEATEGVRNWAALSSMEAEFINAAQRGMRVVLVVRGTPGWAQLYPSYACGPIKSDKFTAFANFMAALVARYSQAPYNVKYWEIGNEPDVSRQLVLPDSLFGCWGDDDDVYYGGGYYASMLQAIYPRIKAADPAAQVLVGGLLLDCDPRPASYGCQSTLNADRPPKFLEGILRNGGGAYFDGVAFHAYDYSNTTKLGLYRNPNWHSDSATTPPVGTIKAAFIRSVLNAYGVTGKYLMNTESAVLCGECDNNPIYEMTKAYYVAQVYSISIMDDLRANIWYRVFGWPTQSSALLNTDLSSRPAYTAFQTVASVLAGASYDGEVTATDVGGVTNVRGYKFKRGNQRTWVVWSTDAETHTLQLTSAPQTIRDVFGNVLSVTTPTSITLVPSNRLLVYLTWLN